jgi:A/G-specific adenine glycosylase
MLQQTQASRVVPAYRRFLRRFPTLASLASAPSGAVIAAWDGLGYNRRAVALSRAARMIVESGGGIPSDPTALERLPGIGPYTAAAVASIAFGLSIPAVDTNVRRIVARVSVGADPREVPSWRIAELAGRWIAAEDPGGWNQALMDLGREVCRPRPRCAECPLRASCRFADIDHPAAPGRGRSSRFEGSTRQVRGAVVRSLRGSPGATLGAISARTGFSLTRVVEVVAALSSDGLIHAGPAALEGRPAGRVRLPD